MIRELLLTYLLSCAQPLAHQNKVDVAKIEHSAQIFYVLWLYDFSIAIRITLSFPVDLTTFYNFIIIDIAGRN